MANLYARIGYDHHARHVSRTSHKAVFVVAETWHAKITTWLDKHGNATVYLTDKQNNPISTLWEGNIDELARE